MMTISRQTISIIILITANKKGNCVSRRTFKTKEAIQVFSKHLQPGEEKTHGELVEMDQKIRQVKEDIQNIPVAKFKTTEDFEKLQRSLHYLEKIKEEL